MKHKVQPLAPKQGALKLDGLSNLLGFHLRMAQVAIYRDFMVELGELNLTQKQYATLHLIKANRAVSQGDVAATLQTDRVTMMTMVNRLKRRGLVVRAPSQIDRRRLELYLTPQGEHVLSQAKAAIERHENRFIARFTEEELKALMDALNRIHSNRCCQATALTGAA